MVSELSLIYSVGKRWSGSMIELGYGHNETNFNKDCTWMEPVEESTFKCLSRRDSSHTEGQRGLITGSLIIERFIESNPCCDVTDGTQSGCVLPPSLGRYLLQILKEKAGFRHSLTSLLPTERQGSNNCSIGYELRHRKLRCRSCEPQVKSPQLGSSALSSFIFDRYILDQQNSTRCAISPPRKRLSLSDSEISYTKDLPEPKVNVSLEHEDAENTHANTFIETSKSTESSEESMKTPIFDVCTVGEDEEASSEPVAPISHLASTDEDLASNNLDVTESPKKSKKKCVRFADDVGDILCQERLIIDNTLPPTLHLSFDDDFRDLGDLDDSLTVVTKPLFKAVGSNHSGTPDMKIPPPIPKLHSSNSNETMSLGELKSPQGSTSPTNCGVNWRLTFAQPAAQYLAFRQRLDSNYVSLENVTLTNRKECSNSLYLYGTVKVKNITFEKHVKLRVTTDRWQSHKDYPAVHNAQLSARGVNSPYDTFMFNFSVEVSLMPEPRELQFAVCFEAGQNGECGVYWDNNDGCNYMVREEVGMTVSSPVGSYESFCNHPPVGSERSPTRTAVGGNEQNFLSSSPLGTAYTQDYRPNFNAFSSLTCYSSWQHYSSESMYY